MGKKLNRIWKGILIECIGIMVLAVLLLTWAENGNEKISIEVTGQAEKEYIKWVDFTVTYEALCKAYDWDVKTIVNHTLECMSKENLDEQVQKFGNQAGTG